MPNAARVGIAYLFTAISMGISVVSGIIFEFFLNMIVFQPYFWIFVPYPAIVEQLRTIAQRVQLLTGEFGNELVTNEFVLDEDTYVVYGIGMREDPANVRICSSEEIKNYITKFRAIALPSAWHSTASLLPTH